MANEEQLEILKQGVEVWNQWREEHPDEKIDLSKCDLTRKELSRVNLSGVNLSETNFNSVDLNLADLSLADLRRAKFIKATLNQSDLHLSDLSEANFNEASLMWADLSEVKLNRANLSGADLSEARLNRAILSQAIITGVSLYGTARDEWIIDKITCDYVYWDILRELRTPKDRDFRPGEFEELYKQLPTFEYVFEQGIKLLDMALIDLIVNEFNTLHPEWELKIDSFQARSQPRAVFSIREKDLIVEVFDRIKNSYEAMLHGLKGERNAFERALDSVMQKMVAHSGVHIGTIAGNANIQQVQGGVKGNMAGRDSIAGNKEQRSITSGRDYLEHIENSDVTTGSSESKDE